MKRISICAGLVLCIGCGPLIHVNVDAISSGKLLSSSECIILPADPNTMADQLQHEEYSKYIRRALEKKGYRVAEKIEDAGVVVFLKYGISEPHESVYSYSTPVWGQTGVSSSHTTGTIHSYGSGMASFSGTTTHMPEYGITGYQTHIGTRITYTRFVQLSAYDLEEHRKTNEEIQLWGATAVSTGSSGDLRLVFPVMVAALAEYIGEDTGKQIRVILCESDKRVQEIKGLIEK